MNYFSEPYKNIFQLKGKFESIDLLFTDKKVIINGLVYADFAKPVLLPDMDYIIKKLHKNAKIITYQYIKTIDDVAYPKTDNEICFSFHYPYYFSMKDFIAMRKSISIDYGLLIFKNEQSYSKYFCPNMCLSKDVQEIFHLFSEDPGLILSYATWRVMTNTIRGIARTSTWKDSMDYSWI